ncbi:MAG: hypothetical protein J6B68_05475 [Lachnospiraceae bacterium]|nr:hypothetical protein [Lachnospiraceae bacterium]
MKNILDYMYVNYDDSQWVRIIWRAFYNEEEIDNLYLGSSHVYCDLNPYLLDELNGENNFSLSTSAQRLNGSYYLLKEADKEKELSHVYLELNYGLATGKDGEFKDPDNLTANWWNVDYMRFSPNKLEYMFTMCDKENYPETLLPFLRYKTRIFDLNYIKEQVEGKQKENYKNYEFRSENEQGQIIEFYEKGYWKVTRELSPYGLLMEQKDGLQENPLTQDAETCLRKIIEYCQEEQIEITLFSTPVYELDLIATGNYDAYVSQINEIAEEYQIEYYDFNLCKEEKLPLQSVDNFWDTIHLNSKGADTFTRVFWDVVENNQKDYFYDSFEEKLNNAEERVYGFTYSKGTENREFKIASNREENLEYRVVNVSEDGEALIQDYSTNKEFSIPYDTSGKCKVEVRRIGETEAFQVMEIMY